jgi:class 3 adenylate cyclase
VLFDFRGWSASGDRIGRFPTFEEWDHDFDLVTEAAGVDSPPVVIGFGEAAFGIPYQVATHPDRYKAMILVDTYSRFLHGDDYPIGLPPDRLEAYCATMHTKWGSGETLSAMAPSLQHDAEFRHWYSRCERLGAPPSVAVSYFRDFAVRDMRSTLPLVQTPTLVLHRTGDRYIRVDHGRYLAEHIAGAKYVELPGDDHLHYAGDANRMLEEIELFITGVRPPLRTDRTLATVLFSDIVDSTRHATSLGDAQWRAVLDRHDHIVENTVAYFRGRHVKSTGDGVLAVFDGPGRAIDCALELRQACRELGLELRSGLHAGEIEIRSNDISGIAVHLAARIEAAATPGDVLVSRTVVDLVAGSQLEFEGRGDFELKGVSGVWQLFAVVGPGVSVR